MKRSGTKCPEAGRGSRRHPQQGPVEMSLTRIFKGTRFQSPHLLSQRIFPVVLHQKNLEEMRQNPSDTCLGYSGVGRRQAAVCAPTTPHSGASPGPVPTGKGACWGWPRCGGRQEDTRTAEGVAFRSELARDLTGRDGGRKEMPETLTKRSRHTSHQSPGVCDGAEGEGHQSQEEC